ncbi:hypothetical protein SAMN05216188_103228 [Lentzea xinjiangensis]|uniref:Uncharacterized protein n=1 Tax=Lentzea xinjiangensis TaxID=402600 RepID=A0A1H9GHY9_9PSEU|nr:hypothetical protein SAMN05216188_103228 [Lentzea xinjiangensis]
MRASLAGDCVIVRCRTWGLRTTVVVVAEWALEVVGVEIGHWCGNARWGEGVPGRGIS